MRISRVKISNFRNFRELDLELGEDIVLVGENKIGKSNFVHAIQLVLDPSLPDIERQLREEDFWDGLGRPLTKDSSIRISVDLAEFESNPAQLAVLAEHLIEPTPMVARLTYEFRPKRSLLADPSRSADFEFLCYGGNRDGNPFGFETRKRLPMMVLPALRDAVRDLANWKNSPLRPLLSEAAKSIDQATLQQIADDIQTANGTLTATKELEGVKNQINDQLETMLGEQQAVDTSLGFTPGDPERLIRSVRLFIDQGQRGVSDASLGSANLLYLTLKALELQLQVKLRSRDHTFLAIEEPEAHLHPHLQRLVYREFLTRRQHLERTGSPPTAASSEPQVDTGAKLGDGDILADTTVIFTTHSPHVVSVSPLRSLALLKREVSKKGATYGVSTAKLDLAPAEVEDLERYLDVSRGELLFASAVLLVEGEAELYIVPALAAEMDRDLDRGGVTVCSVAGTHFRPYVALLGPNGLGIPFAVITDGDSKEGSSGLSPGQKRCLELLPLVSPASESQSERKRLAALEPNGLFMNTTTLELELLSTSERNGAVMSEVLLDLLDPGKKLEAEMRGWIGNPETVDSKLMLKRIGRVGKGRFAQRLASRADELDCPPYLQKAIARVTPRA